LGGLFIFGKGGVRWFFPHRFKAFFIVFFLKAFRGCACLAQEHEQAHRDCRLFDFHSVIVQGKTKNTSAGALQEAFAQVRIDSMSETVYPELIPADAEIVLPLSTVFDRFAQGMPRNQQLVRTLVRWWSSRSSHIRLEILDLYPADQVLVAFHMDSEVRFVVTGWAPNQPVELTFTVRERNFPHIHMILSAEPIATPVSLAVLDYGCRGQEMELILEHEGYPAGTLGKGECWMDVDGHMLLRVRINGGPVLQIPQDSFRWRSGGYEP